jgi:Zn finger protein HypA/HybF involved in hydrogenase expression
MPRLTFDAVNQRKPGCPKCGYKETFVFISNLEERREVFALFEKKRTIEAIGLIRRLGGCDLVSAKATYQHFANLDGTCHRCGTPVEQSLISDCPKCHSVNIRYDEEE